MPITELASLVEAGFLGRALRLLADASHDRSLTLGEQVLQLELIDATSSFEAVHESAAKLLTERQLGAEDRVRCLIVAGTSLMRHGQDELGNTQFRQALSIAAKANHRIRALAQIGYLAALASWVGPDAASLEVSKGRKLVVAAGIPALTIRFHLAVGAIAAKRGYLQRALHHLDVAESLLTSFPNEYLNAQLALIASAVSTLASDLGGAIAFAHRAIELSKSSGAPTLEVVARTNLGHAQLANGDLDSALSQLKTTLALCRVGGGAELGIRDGLLQHALAAGLPAIAADLAEATLQLSSLLNSGHSYYGLWHLLTRVKWLYRTGDATGGLTLALESLPAIERMADRNLLDRMKLLAAEGLGRVGRADEGANVMAEAFAANPDPPLEMVAETARVAGRLAAADSLEIAATHFDRAARIFRGVGNVTASADVTRDAEEATTRAPGTQASDPSAPPADSRPPAAPLVERVAALIDMATHPPLLAAETLSLLADTQAAINGAIVARSSAGDTETIDRFGASESEYGSSHARSTSVSIRVGAHRDRTYEVIVTPRCSPAARASVLAVERLVQAALVLADTRQRQREQADLWPEPTPEQQLGLVCASESMTDLIKTTRRVASSNIPVLITGETGVGKELFARALHQASTRHERPCISFNCATVPKDLIDSHLFGHRRGAFSGAHDDFSGVIRAAAGGTLFLDEIGELALDTQPKLLRFLESGEIVPLGEAKSQIVDVRVVAATNANLEQLVTDGKFREDLYYRLNVIRLPVPPLRERREEIPLLVQHFIERYTRELNKPLVRVAEDTLEYLVLYRWPGNVRQLANELRRMIALAEIGAVLMPEHLSQEIFASRRTVPASERQLEPTEMVVRVDQPLAAAVEHVERAFIRRAMALSNAKVEDAARILGLSRKGLYLKRQRLKLD